MRLPRAALVLAVSSLAACVPAFAAGVAVWPELHYDAGEVQHGAVVTHDFVLENTGDEPIQITAVRPSCSCTVPSYPTSVEPGSKGVIRVEIDTKTLTAGPLSKTVTVNTDAPGSERVVLKVTMVIVTPLEILPKPYVYLRTRAGEPVEDQVLMRPHRKGMRITGASADSPYVEVALEPAKVTVSTHATSAPKAALLPQPGDVWMTIRLREDAPPGVMRSIVTVRTSDPDYPEARVKVNAAVAERQASGR